jgi:ABC-type Fe3+ transport system substrate-binding protein
MDHKVSGAVSRGIRFFYFQKELGANFVTRLYGETDLVLARDFTQMLDWLAAGKFSLGIFVGSTETAKAISHGLPIKEFSPGQFKEGAAVSPFNGTVSLINRAPHPNAAKVLINWLLSREGQAAAQQHLASEGNIRESLREDISKDGIPASQRRDPRVKYVMISRAADMDGENAALRLAEDALSASKKK